MGDKNFTISGYLKIEGRKQYNYSNSYTGRVVSFTQSKPGLTSNQIAVKVEINVPNAFFERLTPVVKIDLPEEAVVNPNVESVITLSALEIADKLKLEVTDVEDGLRTMIEAKKEEVNKVKA